MLLMIEAKISDESPSKHFKTLGSGLKNVRCIQLVRDCKRSKDYPFGVGVRPAAKWLGRMEGEF